MNYLIIDKNEVFYTQWYQYENHYVEGMIIIDLASNLYTVDGKIWFDIEMDHL